MEELYAEAVRARIVADDPDSLNALAGRISLDCLAGRISEATALALTGEIETFQADRRAMAPTMGGILQSLPPRILISPKAPTILADHVVKNRRCRGHQRVKAKYARIPAVLCEPFTQAMQAVLGQLAFLTEAGTGVCDLPVPVIARRSKVSVRLVQTALSLAKRLGLIGIRYRRRATSLITIISDRWLAYLKPKSASSENEILPSFLELNDSSEGAEACVSNDPVEVPSKRDPVHTQPKPRNVPPGTFADWWLDERVARHLPRLFPSRWETGVLE